MKLSNEPLELERYKKEDGNIIIEVAVNNLRQLFNERDPSPFHARDLDDEFANYVLSSVQEFPLKAKIKLRILVLNEKNQSIAQSLIQEALRGHFVYESKLIQKQLRKRLKTGRTFLFVGLCVLFACLGVAQFLESRMSNSPVYRVISEGFVIIGWVAMWRPIEVVLYDWWPLRELRLYLIKVSSINIEVRVASA